MKPLSENRIPSPTNNRKITKPLIEKKRRARINASLAELKTLLEATLGEEISRDSRMEKADILELAVRHLRKVNRQQMNVSSMYEPQSLDKYCLGYSECASDTSRYLATIPGINGNLKTRIVQHLSNTMHGASEQNQLNSAQLHKFTNQQRQPRPSPIENILTSRNTITSQQQQQQQMTSQQQAMTSQQQIMTSQNINRFQQPIYVNIKEQSPVFITSPQPMRDSNNNYVTIAQPIRNSQQPTLLVTSPIQPMITPLHKLRNKLPIIYPKPQLSPEPWRPW